MREDFVSRQQVNLMPERLRKAEETDATKELKNYLWDLYEKKNFTPMKIMVSGAGASYPAAIFAKHAIGDEVNTPYVEAATPQTAVRILTQFDHVNFGVFNPKYDLVIGISYSGRTTDIKYVAEICAKKKFNFLLLTGAEKSTLSDIYKEDDRVKIVSYFNPEDTTGKEKGIISMVSTLAPAIIFDDSWSSKLITENQEALVVGEKFVSNLDISVIASKLKLHPTIHVFYEWDQLPTAIDIESKFTMSGIANVVLHEKKDFSHSRYNLLYYQNSALIINLTRRGYYFKNEYDRNLTMFLRNQYKKMSVHYIELGTVAQKPSQWNIEAMAKLPYLITAIGEELGVDISKPFKSFSKEVVELYDYNGDF